MVYSFEDFKNKMLDNNKYKYPCDSGFTFESFMKVNNVNDDTITEDMIDWYTNHICTGLTHPAVNHNDFLYHWSYVTEMLKHTNIEMLVKNLNKNLVGTKKNSFVTNVCGKDDDHVNKLWITPDIYDADKISEICDKMQWIFTAVEINKSGVYGNPMKHEAYVNNDVCDFPVIQMMVEPVKTKVITNYVMNNCGGKIYHICNNDSVDKILKTGLRVKGQTNSYRFINNRLFFVCGETLEDVLINLEIVAGTLNAMDYEKISDEFTILEIDVNGYNVDFYQDGYYNDDVKYIGYCYTYFPPKRIRIVDKEELYG